jgi:[protein-PII] uridylyltransferase
VIPALPTETQLVQQLSASKLAIPVLKEALETCRANLEARFHAGEDVEALIEGRAQFVDMVLRLAWARFEWNENLGSWFKTRISLVAVGGYGRGELHPHSDIDLLILLERNNYQRHASNVQSFLTLLWDIGLEVGHSVRSISECKTQARLDVTVITAMIEGRTITGDHELFNKVRHQVGPNKMWSHKAFYEAKIQEQEERHKKFEHIEYSLEPNVKTSPGGLRDIQTVMWIANRWINPADGRVDFDSLVELNFLTTAERDILRAGERLLWKIRFGLHLINGRDEDRLLFDHQRKLAEMFGYEDGDQLAVEQFMKAYYRTAMVVSTTSELLLQHFNQDIIQSKKGRIEPINERFQLRNNYIEACHDNVFVEHPPALMEIFLLIGANDRCQGTTAATVRLIRQNLNLIDDEFRTNPEVTGMFMELLRTSEVLSSQLRRMERYGVLGSYLPEFGRIIGQMQFDLFHIYTVDAHTLQVVRNMRRFRYRDQAQKFPVAAHIYPRLPKVELLFIAGLYHDIAKGMGGDHSQLGIDIARRFCERHNLTAWDTNLVCWLVEQHLVMSSTAQRKDITDPEVIHEFASIVKDQVRLDYIYTLTVADINATNPTLWNSWRASLLSQLYNETKKLLRHGVEVKVEKAEYITENQDSAITRLEESGLSREQTLSIWADVDEEFFLRESVSDIARFTTAIAQHQIEYKSDALVLIEDMISRRENEGATQIFIYTQNREYIFASIVTAFELLGLDVVDARITRNTDYAFDTFTVLESNGKPVGSFKNRRDQITKLIKEHLSSDGASKPKQVNRTPRLLKSFAFKTDVQTSLDENKNLTVLEVQTPDRPGLLSIIANVFVDMDIHLHNAKITTLGDRVEDLFYITDSNTQPLTDTTELANKICQELDHRIEREIA